MIAMCTRKACSTLSSETSKTFPMRWTVSSCLLRNQNASGSSRAAWSDVYGISTTSVDTNSCLPHNSVVPMTPRRPIRRRSAPGQDSSHHASASPRCCAPPCSPAPRQRPELDCAPASGPARIDLIQRTRLLLVGDRGPVWLAADNPLNIHVLHQLRDGGAAMSKPSRRSWCQTLRTP